MKEAGQQYARQKQVQINAFRDLERTGVLPQMIQDGNAWRLRYRDGKELIFRDQNDAIRARLSFIEQKREEFDTPTRALIDTLIPSQPDTSPQTTPKNLDNPHQTKENENQHETYGQTQSIPLNTALAFLQGLDARGSREGDREISNSGRSGSQNSSGHGTSGDPSKSARDFVRRHGAILSERWLDTLVPRQGGAEHQTYLDQSEPDWRIKVTGPDLRYQDGTPRQPPLTETEYLDRLHTSNIAFGDDVQIVGVIPTKKGDRLVTRQPEVMAHDPENPYPANDAEVAAWLQSAGFERSDDHWQNWIRKADGLELDDVHPGNFIKTSEGLRLIDVQLRQSDEPCRPVQHRLDSSPPRHRQASQRHLA